MTGQCGGGGAAHVAVGALVVIHVAPHVVPLIIIGRYFKIWGKGKKATGKIGLCLSLPIPQVTLDGKLLLAGDAGKGVSLLLLQAVIHELDSVGKQPSTGWAAHQPLLAVTTEMFLSRSFSDCDND